MQTVRYFLLGYGATSILSEPNMGYGRPAARLDTRRHGFILARGGMPALGGPGISVPDFSTLRAEVMVALDAFDQLITGDVASATGQLATTRMKLVQAVNAYIARIGVLFQEKADAPRTTPWRQPFEEVTALRQRYSGHIGRWSSDAVASNWAEYTAASARLVSEMRRHPAITATLPPPA